MPAAQPGVPQEQPTLEQRIDDAAVKASSIVASFNPQIAMLIQAGVAIEPVLHGMSQMFLALFKHHVSQPAAQ